MLFVRGFDGDGLLTITGGKKREIYNLSLSTEGWASRRRIFKALLEMTMIKLLHLISLHRSMPSIAQISAGASESTLSRAACPFLLSFRSRYWNLFVHNNEHWDLFAHNNEEQQGKINSSLFESSSLSEGELFSPLS